MMLFPFVKFSKAVSFGPPGSHSGNPVDKERYNVLRDKGHDDNFYTFQAEFKGVPQNN